MIEKYFVKGLRLRWAHPGDGTPGAKDGSFINQPPLPPQPMIYDGLDGELVNFGMPHVSVLGLTKGMSIPYDWLSYTIGHTCRTPLTSDVLTGYMSGCPIVTWTDRGVRYVGHLGTEDSQPVLNTAVRKTFSDNMPRDVQGFNPFGAWDNSEIVPMVSKFKKGAGIKIVALVTATGKFYSLLMFQFGNALAIKEWCVGGAKLVPPLGWMAMRKWLTPDAPIIGGSRG